ncbi:hypothetical protein AFAE65S_02871 [Alcaligenes phenolicus]
MSNKTFAEVLQDLRYGTLHDELTEKMQAVVNACISTGKAGSLNRPGFCGGSNL